MFSIGESRSRHNLADRKKHDHGLRSIAQGSADHPHGREPWGPIKVDCILFGIDDHTDTAGTITHLQGQFEHGPQQQPSDTVSQIAFVHREQGKAENRRRVSGQASSD